MNILIKAAIAFLSALKSGEELSSSTQVKKAQVVANGAAGVAVGAVTLAKAAGVDIPVDAETINTVANGVVSMLAVFNVGATVATSKKIGF